MTKGTSGDAVAEDCQGLTHLSEGPSSPSKRGVMQGSVTTTRWAAALIQGDNEPLGLV